MVDFQLTGEGQQSEPLTVPILVGNQGNQEYPITGFNVIKEVIKGKSNSDTPDVLTQVVNDSFPSVAGTKAAALVNFLQTKEEEADMAVLRVRKHAIHLAPGETTRIKCPVHFGPLAEDVPFEFSLRDCK